MATQESLLFKGPNYVITPKSLPNIDYITGIETACKKLINHDAEELRADVNGLLRQVHAP